MLHTNPEWWEAPKLNGDPLPPRYSHSATAVGSDMVLIGGKYKDYARIKSTDVGGAIEVFWLNGSG